MGRAMVDELDQMKGMAMKVGQILSYMDGALPPETQVVLARLQEGTAGVPFAVVTEVLEAELGGSVSELFDRMDPEPVAAASIGQVHRAWWEGEPVAVKVRYPEVAASFDDDVSRLHQLARIASAATSVDGAALVRELHARLREECDYTHEARWQQRFGLALSDIEGTVIPEVIAERSTSAVLTTRWLEGRRLADFQATGTDSERQRAARLLATVAWRSVLVHGAVQADPHPGNFVFLPAGRLGLLDFGCVRVFDDPFWSSQVAVLRAVIDDARSDFDDAVVATGMVPRPARFDFETWWAQLRWQYRPYCTETFRFTPAYMAEARRFNGPGNTNMRHVALPPPWIWWMRLVVGLHAVLTRLGAEGAYRGLILDALETPRRSIRDGSTDELTP